MECHTDPAEGLRDQKLLAPEEKKVAARTRHGTKLRDILMSDKPTSSYADFHQDVRRNSNSSTPRSSGKQQSQVAERKAIKEDELVRYMSKLPSYLEKGKNIQEKALNVGVLDWRRLEKWQGNRLMPQKNSGHSPASSISSFFSTDGSSTLSSRGLSCSPAHQRMHNLPLQSHLDASPKQNFPQDIQSYAGPFNGRPPAHQSPYRLIPHSHHPKAYPWECNSQNVHLSGKNAGKFPEASGSTDNKLITQRKLFRTDQASGNIRPEIRQERCERKGSVSKSSSGMGKSQALDDYEVASSRKGMMETHERVSAVEVAGLQESNNNISDQDCFERNRTVVLPLPKDKSQNSGMAHSSDLSMANVCTPEQPGGRSPSWTNNSDKVHSSNMCSDTGHSFPLPNQNEIEKTSEIGKSYSTDGHGVKASSRLLHGVPHSAKILTSSSRIKNSEEKKPILMLKSSSAIKASQDLDIRTVPDSATKSRNTSPIRRLGLGMARIIRNASSRDNSPQRKSVSQDIASKPGSERAAASVPLDNLSNEKLLANNRARSSPLRRLLDPLLKPKGPHCLHSTEHLKRDSTSTVGPCKSSDKRYDFPNSQSVKLKSGVDVCRTSSANASYLNPRCGSSSFQALLQVAVKNGLPLFTFAVENSSEILAATLRKSSSPVKDQCSWIYTFFTIREIKRKSRIWSNQGLKGSEHGYVPNVVAQMKTLELQFQNCSGCKCMENDNVLEFALSAADVGRVDQNASEFHPTNELAAIVFRLPRKTTCNQRRDGQPANDCVDLSHTCSREQLSEIRHPNFCDDSQNVNSVSQNILSTTVILPGGVHTVPSNGEISTLAQRWKSGGSCDCGGWDLGCQLRIYSNQNAFEKKWSSAETCVRDEFELFSQVAEESQRVLSLAPFKDRIYSVEFNASISVLQAFAICVAALECGRPSGLLGPSRTHEEDSPGFMIPEGPFQTKATSQNQAEAPARYVSYPPHSPVGRV
ncbi:hypothetical protein Ancab_011545 [Ancistrocladus abbreviatus]